MRNIRLRKLCEVKEEGIMEKMEMKTSFRMLEGSIISVTVTGPGILTRT